MTKRDTSKQDDEQRPITQEQFPAFTGKLLRGSEKLEKQKRQVKERQESPKSGKKYVCITKRVTSK